MSNTTAVMLTRAITAAAGVQPDSRSGFTMTPPAPKAIAAVKPSRMPVRLRRCMVLQGLRCGRGCKE